MVANFPSNPTFNDIVLISDIKYRWNGSKWGISPQAVVSPIVQSDDGIVDLSKGNYHKIDITSSNLIIPVSFTNVTSRSSRWHMELTTSFSTATATFTPIYDNVFKSSFPTNTVSYTFKPDGTKIYVLNSSSDSVLQYSLTTPWDITTITSDGISFNIAGQETTPTGLEFKPDGTKMYVMGLTSNRIHQYTLSTPWNISTATYDVYTLSTNPPAASPQGFVFKPDGTKLYIIGSSSDSVHQYGLSTPWEVRTALLEKSFSVATQDTSPVDIQFSSQGDGMYVLGNTGDDVNLYNLSTPWEVDTAVFVLARSVAGQNTTPNTLLFKSDGSKMYMTSTTALYQYSVSGIPYAISVMWPSNIIWKNNTPPIITENQKLIIEFYTPDSGETIYGIEYINIDNT